MAQKKSKKASNRVPAGKKRDAKTAAASRSKKMAGSAVRKSTETSSPKSGSAGAATGGHSKVAIASKTKVSRSAQNVSASPNVREIDDKKNRLDRDLAQGEQLSNGAALAGTPRSKKAAKPTLHGNEVMEAVSHKTSDKSSLASNSAGDPVVSDTSAAIQTASSIDAVSQPSANPLASPKAIEGVGAASPKAAKPAGNKHGFKTGEHIVYPSHGVGQIVSIEEKEVAGFKLELFVISFSKDKMTLRVPIAKVPTVGMRKLADDDTVKRALDTLLGRARVKRTMWSRRAQEYEAKINSGDLIAIAEVVRDLYRSEAQPEQSYSERQLYEAALARISREIAVVQKFGEGEALKAIELQLQKGQRRAGRGEAGAEAAGASSADVEEAA